MAVERIEAVNALLVETMTAHGVFETTELHGIYDQDWSSWYAAYAVEHGIGELLGHVVTTERLARFLANSNLEFEQTEPTPDEPWATYTARRLTTELST
jgi:hypothetical protein